jgi:hypothetical protein
MVLTGLAGEVRAARERSGPAEAGNRAADDTGGG